MITPAHFERGIAGQLLAGLSDLGLTAEDYPGEHEGLRAGAAFRQPAIDQHLVDTHFRVSALLSDRMIFGRVGHVSRGLAVSAPSFHTGAMKANAPRSLALAAALLAFTLAGCASTPKPKHHPTPQPEQVRPARPVPSTPVAPRPPAADWRDQPRSMGDWSWSRDGQFSIARYGRLFSVACSLSDRRIALMLAISVPSPQPMVVTTTSTRRALSAEPEGGQLTARLPASDPLIDAMAFSRGRFMIEAGGTAPLYLPSWPELTRVAEDCR